MWCTSVTNVLSTDVTRDGNLCTMASSFACYFPAEEPFFFSIEVKSNAWVSDILKAIRSELRDLYRLDLCQEDLHLFKVSMLHLSQAIPI